MLVAIAQPRWVEGYKSMRFQLTTCQMHARLAFLGRTLPLEYRRWPGPVTPILAALLSAIFFPSPQETIHLNRGASSLVGPHLVVLTL